MLLTEKAIVAFRMAYLQDTGELLSYHDASVRANELMHLMAIVSRPVEKDKWKAFQARARELGISDPSEKHMSNLQAKP